jgi:hypothetical protein
MGTSLCQDTAEDLVKTIDFLRSIGINVSIMSGVTGFLSDCRIVDGNLVIDLKCPISNILHEAGHLAIIPEVCRAQTQDDVDVLCQQLFADDVLNELPPDHPFSRALINGGDQEATAWAWAAGKAIGLADEQIIQDREYDGEGALVRLQLSTNGHPGIHGLAHSGMCNLPNMRSSKLGLTQYPEMLKWSQDARPDIVGSNQDTPRLDDVVPGS